MKQKNDELIKDAVLRVGEVSKVFGRTVHIKVDKEKNLTHLVFNGEILRNVSVGSFIEIKKGFLSLVGKVDGEEIKEEFVSPDQDRKASNKNNRYLQVSLFGYLDHDAKFNSGIKELPLIGNEAFIMTKEKIEAIHNLPNSEDKAKTISIATVENTDMEIAFPVNGLFNSHIAILGNTGSGKTYTLAHLYQALLKKLSSMKLANSAKFLLFDFNGEYTENNCITNEKTVHNLSTSNDNGDKIILDEDSFLDLEMLSILSQATEKTQKPFLNRGITFYNNIKAAKKEEPYFKNILKKYCDKSLQLSEKTKAKNVLNYWTEHILSYEQNKNDIQEPNKNDVQEQLVWHDVNNTWYIEEENSKYYSSQDEFYEKNKLSIKVKDLTFENFGADIFIKFRKLLYLKLIIELCNNYSVEEHIAPVLTRLEKVPVYKFIAFEEGENAKKLFSEKNFEVVNLCDVNLDVKKMLPLLLAKLVYADHKKRKPSQSESKSSRQILVIIIDEAHNILSDISSRESDEWKDYRLETFEEIIKEGRKFGVFVTLASQRPHDISPTLLSQAHNYFIHKLVNERDLKAIGNAVSYIDKLDELSIPTLPVGTCIFSGTACPMPLKININQLSNGQVPSSKTPDFEFNVILNKEHSSAALPVFIT